MVGDPLSIISSNALKGLSGEWIKKAGFWAHAPKNLLFSDEKDN
jgi:hypothetical protein